MLVPRLGWHAQRRIVPGHLRVRTVKREWLPPPAVLGSRFWRYTSTWPVTQVIVPPPTQIAPVSSVEMCTRP